MQNYSCLKPKFRECKTNSRKKELYPFLNSFCFVIPSSKWILYFYIKTIRMSVGLYVSERESQISYYYNNNNKY